MTFKKLSRLLLFMILPGFLSAQNLRLADTRSFLFEDWYFEHLTNPQLSQRPMFISDYEKFSDSAIAIPETRSPAFSKHLYTHKTERGFLSIDPVLISDKAYSLADDMLYMQNGLGFDMKARHRDIFYADILLYGFTANYPDDICDGIDTLGFLPHYNNAFTGSGDRLYSYEADFRLTFTPQDYIRFETGKSRHFFGQGKYSLFMADNAASMPFVSVVADVWRLQYRWAVMRGGDYNLDFAESERGLYAKYFAVHYLTVNLTKRIKLSFFEGVITNAYDQNGKKGLDINYLNPIIFYRPVEFGAGTFDNAILGLGLDIRLFNKFFLYSQLVIDDLIVSEFKARSGWWGNKYGLQAGFKSYDFLGTENVFVRAEFNALRPYTYSHARDNIHYGSYGIPMAHPAGANFADLNLEIKYARKRMLYGLEAQALITGQDTGSVSFGADVYRSYDARYDNYGIEFLQGKEYRQMALHAYGSFLINPKVNISVQAGLRWLYRYSVTEKQSRGMLYLALNSAAFYNVFDRLERYRF